MTIACVKWSTLLFYWRIFSARVSIRMPIFILAGMVSAWAIAVVSFPHWPPTYHFLSHQQIYRSAAFGHLFPMHTRPCFLAAIRSIQSTPSRSVYMRCRFTTFLPGKLDSQHHYRRFHCAAPPPLRLATATPSRTKGRRGWYLYSRCFVSLLSRALPYYDRTLIHSLLEIASPLSPSFASYSSCASISSHPTSPGTSMMQSSGQTSKETPQ